MSGAAAPSDAKVAAVFDACSPARRAELLDLRRVILAAADDARVKVVETLKWGQPAYLPAKPRIGTPVRIDALKGSADGCAMYVHCQTTLVESFRHLSADRFEFEGQRALILRTGTPPDPAPLKHCVTMALTYHRA